MASTMPLDEAESPPLGSGHIKTRTHDYYRHGTTTLFAALNYLDGSIISTTQKRHHHEEWLKFLTQIDAEVSGDMDLHLIADNYSSHKHKEVTAWLNDHPQFHMHFTPTGSSWMNMVERFFADITVEVIRDGSFQSLKELENTIGNYMKTRNRAPKRYVWKAEGQKIHDNKTLERLVSDLTGVVTADAGSLINDDVFQRIYEKRTILCIATRKNMKRVMTKGHCQLFRMRSRIETLWGILKERFLIVFHLARSSQGLFPHYFYSVGYFPACK